MGAWQVEGRNNLKCQREAGVVPFPPAAVQLIVVINLPDSDSVDCLSRLANDVVCAAASASVCGKVCAFPVASGVLTCLCTELKLNLL